MVGMRVYRKAAVSAVAFAASSFASHAPLPLEAAAAALPHPEKQKTGGEDAHFVLDRSFGVFDGVGGWANSGFDPGLFSRALAQDTARTIQSMIKKPPSSGANLDLVRALTLGLTSAVQAHVGTSTACLVHIDESGQFTALNVGDSCFRLIRPSADGLQVVMASLEQTHFFNCPLQLGTDSRDMPSEGDSYEGKVESGDLLVLATDGLIDNLSEDEILRCVSGPLADGRPAMHLAESLVSAARAASMSATRQTPFSQSALQHGYDFPGGKPDDTTVICVKVLTPPNSAGASESGNDESPGRPHSKL